MNEYTVTWKNANGTVLETDTDVPYGTTPTYNGTTPTQDGVASTGWTPEVGPITGNTVYTATYIPHYTATFVTSADDGGQTLWSGRFAENTTPVYGGSTPTTIQGDGTEFEFIGWEPALGPISANTTYTAKFQDMRALTIQLLSRTMRNYTSEPADISVEKFSGSWSDLIDSINDGTYRTKYKVGQYNSVDFGSEGTINMQIIGINRDYDEDGNFIPITLLSMKQLSGGGIPFGSNNNAVSWTNSTVRSRLYSRILNNIPEPLKSHLIPAVKYTVDSGNLNNRTVEELFVPSRHELFENIDSTGTYDSETLGPVYNIPPNRSGWYWTRSKAYPNDNRIQYCQASNKIDIGSNTYQYDVYFGFCIGGISL